MKGIDVELCFLAAALGEVVVVTDVVVGLVVAVVVAVVVGLVVVVASLESGAGSAADS